MYLHNHFKLYCNINFFKNECINEVYNPFKCLKTIWPLEETLTYHQNGSHEYVARRE